MKKLITILLVFFALNSFAQYRQIDWKTYVQNVVMLGVDTFQFDAEPYDFNDPGAATRTIGNFFVDFAGNRYVVIDSTLTTITVKDEFGTGIAPQSDQIGRVYQSVGNGAANYIGGVDITSVDALSWFKILASDNELFWRYIVSVQGIDSLSSLDITSGFIKTYLNGGLVDSFYIGIPLEVASFPEAVAGINNNHMMTPLRQRQVDSLINVPYYGAIDDLYSTFNITGDTIFTLAKTSLNTATNALTRSDSIKAYIDRNADIANITVINDIDNNFTVPFPLKTTTIVFYNNAPLPSTLWTGVGTTTLNVILDTKQYDFLIINKN